jgi:hypothetical protein
MVFIDFFTWARINIFVKAQQSARYKFVHSKRLLPVGNVSKACSSIVGASVVLSCGF